MAFSSPAGWQKCFQALIRVTPSGTGLCYNENKKEAAFMNPIDFVTRFEEDGLHLYEILGEEATSEEQKTIFNLLAETQREHMKKLATLNENVKGEAVKSSTVE